MSAELLPAALAGPGHRSSLPLSANSTVGELALPVRVLDPDTPAPEVDELLRCDQGLSSVVVAGLDGPELISRSAFEFQMAGRLGYGRALYSRRSIADMLAPGTLVLAHDMLLGAAAKAVLARPGRRRYDDAVVLGPGPRVAVLAVTPVFEQLALHFAHRALHDALTGLPNRLLLAEHVRALTGGSQRVPVPRSGRPGEQGAPALLYVDLDGFKAVNDSLGHGAGDAVLTQFAERLSDICRPGDVVARLGGDEFAVLLASAVRPEQAMAVADRIVLAAASPFLIADAVVQVGASVGVTTIDGAAAEEARRPVEVLLREADAAMYRAKSHGRGRAEAFDAARDDALVGSRQRSQTMNRELRDALNTGALELHYQPKIVLASRRVIEFEALARWRHPSRGWISPTEFIPAAEASGLIYQLGVWALTQACAQGRRWTAQLHAEDPTLNSPIIAVNVSPHQLGDPRFVDDVAGVLARTGFAADRLCLEVTESVATDDVAGAVRRLQALRELGVQIALDDFGTGFSSLNLMRQLPLDWIKIDRSFIDSVDVDPTSVVLVRLVIEAAHSLGLKVCAEGIERGGQAEQLIAMGCDAAQGYLFGVPAPADLIDPRPCGLVVAHPEPLTAGGTSRSPAPLLTGPGQLVTLTSSDGVLTYVSAESVRMLGYQPADMVGQQASAFLHHGDAARPTADLPGEAEPPTATAIYRLRHAETGRDVWVETHSQTIAGRRSGAPTQVLTTATEVTGRVQAERELSDRDRRLQAAFDAASVGMAILDADGRWLQTNLALSRITGHCAQALAGRLVHDLSHPDDLAAGVTLLADTIHGTRQGYQHRSRLRHADGQYLWVDLTVSAVRDGDQPTYLILQIQDLTASVNRAGSG